jgi:hypothetical protein
LQPQSGLKLRGGGGGGGGGSGGGSSGAQQRQRSRHNSTAPMWESASMKAESA